MPPEAWTALGVIASAIAAAVSGISIAKISKTSKKVDDTSRKVDDASGLAQQARDYAKPTGNGFAEEIKSSLARVELGLQNVQTDVAGLKEKVADQAVAHARLEGKFDGHMSPRRLPDENS